MCFALFYITKWNKIRQQLSRFNYIRLIFSSLFRRFQSMKRFTILLLIFLAVTAHAQGGDTLSSALEEELRLIGEEDLLLSDPVAKEETTEIAEADTVTNSTQNDSSTVNVALDSISSDTTLASVVQDSIQTVSVDSTISEDSIVTAAVVEIEDTTAVIVETSGEDTTVQVVTVEKAVTIDIESNIEGYKSPLRAMIYSGFVPGLGQAYAKSYWKTGLFVTLETAGIVGAVKFKKTSDEIEEDALKYIESDPVTYNHLMDSSKKRADWSRTMVVGIIVNHIASGVDGFITARRYNRKLAKEKTSEISTHISLDNQLYYSETGSLTTGVSLAWHF